MLRNLRFYRTIETHHFRLLGLTACIFGKILLVRLPERDHIVLFYVQEKAKEFLSLLLSTRFLAELVFLTFLVE